MKRSVSFPNDTMQMQRIKARLLTRQLKKLPQNRVKCKQKGAKTIFINFSVLMLLLYYTDNEIKNLLDYILPMISHLFQVECNLFRCRSFAYAIKGPLFGLKLTLLHSSTKSIFTFVDFYFPRKVSDWRQRSKYSLDENMQLSREVQFIINEFISLLMMTLL